ncbi:MAG: zinc-binding dehydrogenase [Kiritimatiellia bacterium]|nr:alcohol dehydrogenase catalytic domain-containing protein [Lentisphaerota bacterium]
MQALVYTAPNQLILEERPTPKPAAGEALIRIHYAGICGTDMAIVHGAHPRARPPLIPGHEFAGEIVEINTGDSRTDLRVGQRVALFPLLWCGKCRACRAGDPHVCRTLRLIGIDRDGGFAEYAAIPLDHLVGLPADCDYRRGALLEPLAVGVHAVEMAGAAPSDFTVVLGAGPIGIMTCQALRQAGCDNFILSDINPLRLARARAMHLPTLPLDQLEEHVVQASDGEGADLVLECAGAPPAIMQTTTLLRPRGKAVIVSVHKQHPPVDLRSLNFKEITMIGARVYTRANFDSACAALADLDADRVISHNLPLAEGARALTLCEDRSADTCKVLLNMEECS